jgi:NADP-dependent 3-hydroxy acid dehydrogenase YdfG
MSKNQKTVFITGASSGFGEATARRFSAEGHRLVLCGRRLDRLNALAQNLGTEIKILSFDIQDREATEKAIASLSGDFAKIDILVNNAGLALGLEPAYQTNLDEWQTMINTNINGLVVTTRAILPGMVERKKGHIINLGSVAGHYPYPGGSVYGATKAFVDQFTQNLRADLIDKAVRVTNIMPGMCETEFSVTRFKGDKSKADNVYRGMTPLSADNIAECIVWVATLPEHVNINRLEVMPVAQANGGFAVYREE